MSLYRQLVLLIALLSFLMLAGTLWVNFDSTRDFLEGQLASHAQDTATALGISLSGSPAENDAITAGSLVDAVFDRGYYRRIEVRDVAGRTILMREQGVVVEGVPEWFVAHVALSAPAGQAVVMQGWRQSGQVSVWSHPGFAYRKLWQETRHTAYLFAGLGLFLILAGSLSLRQLLRPLRRIEQQARLLIRRQYVTQERLPRTRELRSVVEAMNALIRQVREMFESQALVVEEMRTAAFRDSLTGLGNRRYFERQLTTRLAAAEEEAVGALVLVELEDLQGANARRGHQAGDALVRAVADVLADLARETQHGLAFRTGGATFAVLLPGLDVTGTEAVLQRLERQLHTIYEHGISDTQRPARVGATLYLHGEAMSELMARADAALREKAGDENEAWRLGVEHYRAEYGRQDWEQELVSLVENGGLQLMQQGVWRLPGAQELMHREILLRLPLPGTDKVLKAAEFLPVAEAMGLAGKIDRKVVAEVIAQLHTQQDTSVLAINLSPRSLIDDNFQSWLFAQLEALPLNLRGRICFEFSESQASAEIPSLKSFALRLHALQVGLGLDHYGRSFSELGHLHALRPWYVKLDPAYAHGLDLDEDARFLVRALCSAVRGLGTEVIAEAVQDRGQLSLLEQLGVSGVQGYSLESPQPLGIVG